MRLSLQRKLVGDRGQWRTVGRFDSNDEKAVIQACRTLSEVFDPISWRIVNDDRWQEVLREF